MNTRRTPFQFSTTDPLARQRELEKRFGLQPTCPKMYVDVNCPLSMGNIPKETSSPRLQHRVPIFAEGYDHPIHSSSVDSMASVPDNKKPNVRVIPIEVEGDENKSQRHRTYSGPAGTLKDNLASERNESPFKRFHYEDTLRSSKPKPNVEPRIFNIPIQVEGADNVAKSPKVVATKHKSETPSTNGCSMSKSLCNIESSKIDNKVKSEPDIEQTGQAKDVEVLLGKIEAVLTEFKTYESEVLNFNGTSKDKQYRYLDEMLTRCMLRLDDIDTMGNEQIRLSRKNAVRKIQASIDLLESKANVESIPQVETLCENNVVDNNSNDIEMQDNIVSSEDEASSEIKEMDMADDCKKINEGESNSMAESEGMSEETQGKIISSKDGDDCVMQSGESLVSSLQPQPNNVHEIEMPKETVSHDAGILDQKVEESLSLNETAEINSDINISKEASEVEMVEIDVCSNEPGEKIDCETTGKIASHDSDCTDQETGCNTVDSVVQDVSIASPKDAEMEDIQNTLDDTVQSETSSI